MRKRFIRRMVALAISTGLLPSGLAYVTWQTSLIERAICSFATSQEIVENCTLESIAASVSRYQQDSIQNFLVVHGESHPAYPGVTFKKREDIEGDGIAEWYTCPNREESFRIVRKAAPPASMDLMTLLPAEEQSRGFRRTRIKINGAAGILVEHIGADFRSLTFRHTTQLIRIESGCMFQSDVAVEIAESFES